MKKRQEKTLKNYIVEKSEQYDKLSTQGKGINLIKIYLKPLFIFWRAEFNKNKIRTTAVQINK